MESASTRFHSPKEEWTRAFPLHSSAIYLPKMFPASNEKKARPSQEGRAVLHEPKLLSEITVVAAYSRAEIPSENCEVADIQAAGPELDIVECKRVKHVVVDFRVLRLAGSAESSGGIDDSRQRGRGNAGSTYHEPAGAQHWIAVEDPDPGIRVRVKGKVRSSAEVPDDVSYSVLKGRAWFHLAGAAAGILPRVLEFERAGRAVAGDRGASSRNHVRRGARIDDAGTVSSRSKINDSGRGEVRVKLCFLREFSCSETHGDFTASVRSHQLAGQNRSIEQIDEA